MADQFQTDPVPYLTLECLEGMKPYGRDQFIGKNKGEDYILNCSREWLDGAIETKRKIEGEKPEPEPEGIEATILSMSDKDRKAIAKLIAKQLALNADEVATVPAVIATDNADGPDDDAEVAVPAPPVAPVPSKPVSIMDSPPKPKFDPADDSDAQDIPLASIEEAGDLTPAQRVVCSHVVNGVPAVAVEINGQTRYRGVSVDGRIGRLIASKDMTIELLDQDGNGEGV